MALPEDGIDQDMLYCEASLRENGNARRRVHQPELWGAFRSVWDRPQPIDRLEGEKLLKWYDRVSTSLDRSCEETKFEGSSFKEQLDLEGLATDLTCDHNPEDTFRLSRETIALCLHVANVISFNCFLLCSGISLEKYKDAGSVMDMSSLTDKLSRLSEKWKWSGDCENKTYHLWKDHIEEEEEEEAVKLLYQWTLLPLSAVNVSVVSGESEEHDVGGGLDTETCRVKNEDENCKFLEDYDSFFSIGEVNIDFLYKEFTECFCRTASLYCRLGNYDRAGELLEKVRQKLDSIDDDTMVTKWGHGQSIEYLPRLEPIMKFQRELYVLNLLDEVNISKNQDRRIILEKIREKEMQLYKEAESKYGWDLKKFISDQCEHGQIRFLYDIQLFEILELIGNERYSEAGETFKKLNDLNYCRSTGVLRDFLEHLNLPHHRWMSASGSPLTWESACEKQNLFLDLCEYVDDHQLTAKFLQQYGIMIGNRSFGKLPKQHRGIAEAIGIAIGGSQAHAEEASTLKLWLEEELNLELSSPPPECVQEIISCLRDRWVSYEHKRKRPEMVKACRLLKRSIDLYSDLLHNWTPTVSNEVQWLLLLESQKPVHETLIGYLLTIDRFCTMCILEINDPSYKLHDMRPTTNIFCGTGESAFEAFMNVFYAFMNSALVWVERGRTRSLLNQLGPWYNVMKHGDGNPGSESLKEQLIKFDNDEQAATSSILTCQTACGGSSPLFVEYVCLGRTVVAFIIDRNTTIVRTCSYEADKVEILVNEFYDTVCLQKKHNDEYIVAKLHCCLEKLYDILVGPFWEQAMLIQRDPKASLVIVPAKILYKVPFALLRDRKTKKYLFELHTISIAPSLRVLQHCKDRLDDLDRFPLKPEGCILAVGNPAYAKKLLPGTGIEVEDLQSCFDGTTPVPGTGKELEHDQSCLPRRVKTLQQDEATRAKFLKEVGKGDVFGFIHLGVHGHWNGENKTGSLQFAPAQTSGEDSILATTRSDYGEKRGSVFGEVGSVTLEADRSSNYSAAEDMLPSEDIIRSGFQWRTRLVVLSACNSSRGTDYTDCEVNLPRALMIAGVPATVVSQWKVSDSGNPPLMKAFYKLLKRGHPVASALRSAMLQVYELDRCASKIFEWGPFVVWGLPTVQLSKELWDDGMKAEMLDIQKVNTLLESAHNKQTLTDEAMIYHDAICAIERLLVANSSDCRIIAAAENIYTLVPLERLQRFELELEAAYGSKSKELFDFRAHVMYAQAMKGKPKVALSYINKIIKVVVKEHGIPYDELCVQTYRQEKAVIWRLMGMENYRLALDEFNELLKFGEDYECLAQTSYLMALMKDKRAALKYALRAKKVEHPDISGYATNMTLAVKALPEEYRRWLLNVDEYTRETSCPI